MPDVVTLTMNPAIDLSVSVERVTPFLLLYSLTISKISTVF
jgi:fructose-1-phosphate kinase PfkB-like protein